MLTTRNGGAGEAAHCLRCRARPCPCSAWWGSVRRRLALSLTSAASPAWHWWRWASARWRGLDLQTSIASLSPGGSTQGIVQPSPCRRTIPCLAPAMWPRDKAIPIALTDKAHPEALLGQCSGQAKATAIVTCKRARCKTEMRQGSSGKRGCCSRPSAANAGNVRLIAGSAVHAAGMEGAAVSLPIVKITEFLSSSTTHTTFTQEYVELV